MRDGQPVYVRDGRYGTLHKLVVDPYQRRVTHLAEGIQGLIDDPRAGRSTTVTEAYRERLKDVVRRRPRNLGLEYSMWTFWRLADYLAEKTKLRVSYETVRRELAKEDIVFRSHLKNTLNRMRMQAN